MDDKKTRSREAERRRLERELAMAAERLYRHSAAPTTIPLAVAQDRPGAVLVMIGTAGDILRHFTIPPDESAPRRVSEDRTVGGFWKDLAKELGVIPPVEESDAPPKRPRAG